MSTLGDKVASDTVGIKWFRTAVTTVISVLTLVGMVYKGSVWATERIQESNALFVQSAVSGISGEVDKLAGQVTKTTDNVTKLETVVHSLANNVEALSAHMVQNSQPSWRFEMAETAISDGEIGGVVKISAAGYKLRDCGIPFIDLYFVNGNDVYHRFQDASFITDGKGVSFGVDPSRVQRVSYTARIPDDENVQPGRARGFISLTYPDACPAVGTVTAGPLHFRITGRAE